MSLEPRSNPSRRSVLKLGLAATASVTVADSLIAPLARAADAADPYGGLPLGLQSYTLRDRPYKDAMSAEHDLGLHFVEVYSRHVGWTGTPDIVTINGVNAKPDDALAIAKDAGVQIVSIGAIP